MNTVRRVLLLALAGLCSLAVPAETIAGSGSVRRLGAAPG